MRYERDHKSKTRRRILKNAARQIRAKGLAGPAVATVMKASGLTVGGFYKHFTSRDDLLAQAVEEGLSDFGGKLMAAVIQASPAERWKEIVKRYLTLDHCEHCDSGCPVAALAPEIARASPAVKRRVAAIMKERRGRLTAVMPGKTVAEQEKNFTVVFSAMAGAMAIARITPDPAERRKVLTSMRDHLLQSF
jgi:TetR/AcrR family transcriptional repressor of nem operon